jgi:imidazolonepropionase-like amidohydrolase
VPAEILASYDDIPDHVDTGGMDDLLELLRSQRQSWMDNTARLREAGVVMFAGSDTQPGVFPGAGLHRELHLLAEAGLPPIEILRAATLYPARFLTQSQEPSFGRIVPGAAADLVLLNGDPLVDLDAVDDIRAVIHKGVLLERRAVGATSWTTMAPGRGGSTTPQSAN